jgi:hypothetical protein
MALSQCIKRRHLAHFFSNSMQCTEVRFVSFLSGGFTTMLVQLNKCETDPYFLQIFQSNTSVCLIISVFCKSFEPICEPEIVLKNSAADFQANPTDISCKNNFMFSSQILQYAEINIVVHWNFLIKHGPVSHLFSCNKSTGKKTGKTHLCAVINPK